MAVVLLALLAVIAWGLCQLFSGRGAFIHFGGMLGTIMVANVFFVIMPGQRELVAAKQQLRLPDPKHAIKAKQRSVHNTYFTLPVLFIMISNHYALTYAHQYNWLILITLCLIGALIRVYFVKAHFGKPSPLPAIAAVLLLAILVVALKPATQATESNATIEEAGEESAQLTPLYGTSEQQLAAVYNIISKRCNTCHHAQPSHPGFAIAPKGVQFNSAEEVALQAQAIYQQTVITRAMPIGNLTGITENEREQIAQWFEMSAE